MEPERTQQNKGFSNQRFVSIIFCLLIKGFRNFRFSVVFILWLASFANQHTKSIEEQTFQIHSSKTSEDRYTM